MAEIGSALAGNSPQKEITVRDTALVFSTKFGGSFLSPQEDTSESVSYHQFTQYINGTDPLTGFSWNTSLQSVWGPSIWKIQSLTNYFGSGYNVHNINAYIGAFVSEIPGAGGERQLSIAVKQKNGDPGDANPPQTWLLYQRTMPGASRQPDVSEILYEYDCVFPTTLQTTLVTPTVGPGGSSWFRGEEIKAGMCNNGLGGPDTPGAGDWRQVFGFDKNADSGRLQFMTRFDDGGNNSPFDIPGVNPEGQPRRCIRERHCDAVGLGEKVKIKMYIKRPTTNSDRTSGRYYISVTPYSTNVETVVAKWVGGEQIGVQDGVMERFFIGCYSGGAGPYSSTVSNLNIYDSWIYDDDPFSASMDYMDATLYAPFTHTMESIYGRGSSEFVRADPATVINNEGKVLEIPANVPRFTGARYIINLLSATSIMATQSVNIVAGKTYTLSFYGTGTIAFSGAYAGTSLVGTGYNNRVQKTFLAANTSSLTLTVTGECRKAQFEDVTGKQDQTAGEYVSVGRTTAPYYHGCMVDGVKAFKTNKDGSDILRSVLKGLRIDKAVTNTVLWSRDFTQASWVKVGITPTRTRPGADGTPNSGTRLTATAANGTALQTITAAASPGCFSLFIKRETGVGAVSITRDNGASWTDITSLINSDTYTQVAIENVSVLNPVVGIRLSTSGDAVVVDYAQNALGLEVVDPIPTTTVAVTRAVDVARIYAIGNIFSSGDSLSAFATWLVTIEKKWTVNNGAVVGDATRGLFTSSSNSGVISKDGTNTVNGPTGTPAGRKRIGMRYNTTTLETFSEDSWSSVGSYVGSMALSTYIELGKDCACNIRDLAIWNQCLLTNAQVQEVIAEEEEAVVAEPLDVRAFPTAQGFGAAAVGGRGGTPVFVTNLNDSGAGSLREALTATFPRTVIFKVGGTINLLSDIDIIESMSYLTVAGQTALGGGIQTRYKTINVTAGAHDIVIRHLRHRRGWEDYTPGEAESNNHGPGLSVYSYGAPCYNVIIDHSSFAWQQDDNSFWQSVHDCTWQWSIMAEGKNTLVDGDPAPLKGINGKGLVGGTEDGDGALMYNISMHHNFLPHNFQRSPLVKGAGLFEVVNNLVYNWAAFGTSIDYTNAEGSKVNLIGNYYKEGPDAFDRYAVTINDASHPADMIYVSDNISPQRTSSAQDEWDVMGLCDGAPYCNTPASNVYQKDTPWAASNYPITISDAVDVPALVLAGVGATLPARDATDARLAAEYTDGTGSIHTFNDWPVLASGTAPVDTDGDGIPDEWAIANGLDPYGNQGASLAANGYTNLENYLNSIAP